MMVSIWAIICLTVLARAWTLEFPGILPLDKRQDIEPGTPLYECHANCGYAILASESNNYCSNSTFTSDLSACLDCALTYDIWQYYGDQVAAAAEACGDNATPSASSTSASPSSTGSVASSTAVTGAVSTTASSSSGSASIAAVPTSVSQTSASNSSSTASSTSAVSTSQETGAASSLYTNLKSSLIVAFGISAAIQISS